MTDQNRIDLRSDTVTQPSPGMRRAMAEAIVGDDVLGDDPTVTKLEMATADLLGKEAAVFVPSGTMSNQIALYTIGQRGDELLCETGCHIVNYEAGAPAALAGLLVHLLDGERGVLAPETIAKNIRPIDIHCPKTSIVALENTNNRAGGTIYPLDTIQAIEKVARDNNLWMHLDGARLWNAHIAAKVALDKYAACFDSVSICFSKGLGAPVGSILLGDKQFIEKARRTRKLFGGGMRQSGVLAAAALYALENNLLRLAVDHTNAKNLAVGMNQLDGITIDSESVETNIIIADIAPDLMTADQFQDKLEQAGVHCFSIAPQRVRLVTHLDVSAEQCQTALEIIKKVISKK